MRLHLLMPAPAQPFGRRNLSRLPQSRPLEASALPPFAATLATSAETETSAAVSKFAASLAEERRKMDENKILQGPRIVPRSRRAALLAGLVVKPAIGVGQHRGASRAGWAYASFGQSFVGGEGERLLPAGSARYSVPVGNDAYWRLYLLWVPCRAALYNDHASNRVRPA